ncbi:MAG: 4-deoxy-4-formamido-L-arabinose-phosphoundecaprenol deformylase [Kiritimatiellae bacterium]|jgi:undecaprenyl phosphate-alpha-L-ara4FN deformylase|nr:4-deoxy-4-formamido-L-arabinose-phosphoundecaprenol deformylase [Kiritimatiellia bacterium]
MEQNKNNLKVGLRIDVDTLRGTIKGVPTLCSILKRNNIKATFYFSVGPDNMGRNLWRLLKPTFLIKMLRSNASNLYGWDIIFKGTFWPGPIIGKNKKAIAAIKLAYEDGHEIGLHAWDHHGWQANIEKWKPERIYRELQKAYSMLKKITGSTPSCSAAPGWRSTDETLLQKDKFNFKHNSDCRGEGIFVPTVNDEKLKTPQIPQYFPTYDELIGTNGINDENYNEHIIELITKSKSNSVFTIHAEVEGIVCSKMFDKFLNKTEKQNISFLPLKDILPTNIIETNKIILKEIPGREGTIACKSG